MSKRRSIITLTAIAAPALATPALATPALAQDTFTPIESPGSFVFRIDHAGNAVCNLEPDFMFETADRAAAHEPLFCALYIDGVLQPPYPGFAPHKPDAQSLAVGTIPSPAAGAMLLLACGTTAARRRR